MEYSRLMELVETYDRLTTESTASPAEIRELLKILCHATDVEIDFLLKEVYKT
jgi:hypothetical protein